MKVIDLTHSDIEKACETLISQFDCEFDLVVGIATGGRLIAETIAGKLNLPVLLVIRQRSLTQHKGRVKNLLKYIPKKILNAARIAENRLYEFLLRIKKSRATIDELKTGVSQISIISDDFSCFNNPEITNILLVDDAIDSGSTIKDTENFLKSKNRNWHIKTAVITQTFSRPLRKADYQIYNRTLVRFPWSNDCNNA